MGNLQIGLGHPTGGNIYQLQVGMHEGKQREIKVKRKKSEVIMVFVAFCKEMRFVQILFRVKISHFLKLFTFELIVYF